MSDKTDLPLNDEGTHVATLSPTGIPWLCPVGYLDRALEDGFTVNRGDQPAQAAFVPEGAFDPGDHTVDEVNAHLDAAFVQGNVTEIERVLASEAAGKNRSTINDPTSTTA